LDRKALDAYVDAACVAQGLVIAVEQRAAVAEQFARVAQLAQSFLDFPLDPDDEPAPVYRP
jgi:hypothetical protein